MTPLTLHLVTKTKTKIVLGWTAVPGAEGFEFLVDGRRSNTWDGTATQASFSASAKKITVNALGIVAQGTYPAATPPPPPPPPPPGTNSVPPPAAGVYFGAYIEGANTFGFYYPSEAPWGNGFTDTRTVDRFERDAGKKLKLAMFGQPNFFTSPIDYNGNLAASVARGCVPVVDVMTSQTGTLVDFGAGKYDAAVTAVAKGAAAFGNPFVLRIDAEMNGGWYDFGKEIKALNSSSAGSGNAAFVAAWRHIVSLFRANGASNVSFHWCPNVDPESIQTKLENLYPGDAYVDWSGMTGYEENGETAEWIFSATYARLVALTAKPIMIGETGALDAGYPNLKVTSINEFFSRLQAEWPQVKAFCWFNWRTNEGDPPWDWPIESSAAGLAAFQKAVANTYIIGR